MLSPCLAPSSNSAYVLVLQRTGMLLKLPRGRQPPSHQPNDAISTFIYFFLLCQGKMPLCSEILSPFWGCFGSCRRGSSLCSHCCLWEAKGSSEQQRQSLIERKTPKPCHIFKPTSRVAAWKHTTNLSQNLKQKGRHSELKIWSSVTSECWQGQVHLRRKPTCSHLLYRTYKGFATQGFRCHLVPNCCLEGKV